MKKHLPLSNSYQKHRVGLILVALKLAFASSNLLAQITPHQQLARDIHKELVEINTVTATGDTLRAAQAMAARLKSAGFSDDEVKVLSPGPRKGNLVARLRGSGARKPMMMLAHLDVVEAKPEDWSTDPFKVVEKDGFLYGRGVIDNKFMAAAFIANLIRYKQEGFRSDRDLIVVLETDEEILDANVQGIQWLLKHHRPLIDAEFALNEGGSVGLLNGKPQINSLQTSEKVSYSYRLEVKNRGGHSSQPTKDNAIYRLADGLARLSRFDFPVQLNETTRAYFERSAALVDAKTASEMRSLISAQPDPVLVARLAETVRFNSIMRTTCVTTLLEAGHAVNALAQTARATVNCRIMPGVAVEEIKKTLAQVMADDQIGITGIGSAVPSPPSPLNPEILSAVEKLSAEFWPGVTVMPTMLAAATDGSFLRNAGIPTYGHSGVASDLASPSGVHGRDERISLKSFYDGLEYQYRLVKLLSQ